MNVLVVGCGKIGTTVIDSLSAEGHSVTAIDINPAVLNEITNIYDIMGVCGNGSDSDVLEEADVAHADLFVAVTDSDDANMLSCFLARKLGASHTIARIRSPEYNDNSLGFMKEHLGLSMSINPELLAAKELNRMLKLPAAVKVETFAHNNFEIVELRLKDDSAFNGMHLYELRGKFHAGFLVCAVQRGEEVTIPDGNFMLKSGDKIALAAKPIEIHKLMRELGTVSKQARDVMILGGSRTAYYLARLLQAGGSAVTIIEKDRAMAEELCEALPKAVVIQGDGAQQELLLEEDLLAKDAFVALTGMDEENILMAIFAASRRLKQVIAKVNRDELVALAEQLGLDSTVSPRKIIANVLVRYARALQNSLGSNIETLYRIMDDKAEALEFRVGAEFGAVGVPLKDLRLKPNILVAGIIRDRKTLIPTGEDVILTGDHVIVVAGNSKLQDLSDILQK